MKFYWKQHNRRSKLLLVFNGWGCDETLFENIETTESDFLVLSDYTDTDNPNFDFLGDYHETVVLAWSFGVFAASCFMPYPIKAVRTVAVNGTLYPIDDRHGIPEKIFYGTLNSYDETGRQKFERRITGKSSCFLPNPNGLSQRTVESQLRELEALEKWAGENSKSDIHSHSLWSCALIAERDRIFPSENMKRFWGKKGICVQGDHLPDFQMIVDRYCFPNSPNIEP